MIIEVWMIENEFKQFHKKNSQVGVLIYNFEKHYLNL